MKTAYLLPLLLALGACASSEPAAPKPSTNNYTIDVVRQADGSLKAQAPKCIPWDDATYHTLNNDSLPQLGCATQGNLAKMIADPADLVRGQLPAQPNAKADGDTMASGVQRYHEEKTYTLDTSGSTGTGSSAGQ